MHSSSNFSQKRAAAAQRAALPPAFVRALSAKGGERLCVISRAAFDHNGDICAVEWGVMDDALFDWCTPPATATADQVMRALVLGVQLDVIFPTATGFARGATLIVEQASNGRTRLALQSLLGAEWEFGHLSRLKWPPKDTTFNNAQVEHLPAQTQAADD